MFAMVTGLMPIREVVQTESTQYSGSMESSRIGLLVLCAVAITSTAMLVTTRGDGPAAHDSRPLNGATGQAQIDPASLAALVESIGRLIETLQQAPTSRLEAVAAGPLRQAVPSVGDAAVIELLRDQNALLEKMSTALLAGARGDVEPNPRARVLRDTVGAGPSPVKSEAWADYFARRPPASIKDLGIELAVLGVADILERFGWPQQTVPPSSSTGNWVLVYRDLAVPTPDGVVTSVALNCDRDGTYHISLILH